MTTMAGRNGRNARGMAAVVAAGCLALGSCATDEPDGDVAATTGRRTATAPAPQPDVTAGPPTAPVTWPVGTTLFTFTEPIGGHVVPVRIDYPAEQPGPGAAPARGSYPLVLLAHGFGLAAGDYGRLIDGVAARGYVVAAPDLPHTSAFSDGNRDDIPNNPAYLGAAADALIAELDRPGSVVPPISHPERIAVMGHSDGGVAAAAMAYTDERRDQRVTAVVAIAGGMEGIPGTWSFPGVPPALLAVHGSADTTVPPEATRALLGALPVNVPRHLVTVDGGDHLAPFIGDTALAGIATVVADFLDVHLQLRGDLSAVDRMQADANTPPLTLSDE